MKRYLLIGNGVAAVGCIEGIRSTDSEGEITVVSEERHPVYCRPLISYYLEKKTDLSRMNYRGEDFYEKMGCRVIYGEKAERIDPKNQKAILTDGSEIPYSSVCVVAGSSPFVPRMEGLETVEKKFGFMTLDDALALEAAINPESRVLIVGAGLIGLKCAEGLHGRVGSITVCDLADRVLSSILDEECAALVQKHLEANGIRFLLGDTALRFDHNTATMKSGKNEMFDILVLAVGVRANTGLIREIGGEVDRGILVNERMETSVSGIYAAGDCAEGYDLSYGGNRMIAILPNAYMQGYAAGVNMAGGVASFNKAIPMNSIGFFGLHIMTAGTYDGDLYEEKTEHTVRRFFTKNGLLKGYILVGQTDRTGIYTSLIREQTPLDTIDFDSVKKIASSLAFSYKTRRKKFGGVV